MNPRECGVSQELLRVSAPWGAGLEYLIGSILALWHSPYLCHMVPVMSPLGERGGWGVSWVAMALTPILTPPAVAPCTGAGGCTCVGPCGSWRHCWRTSLGCWDPR